MRTTALDNQPVSLVSIILVTAHDTVKIEIKRIKEYFVQFITKLDSIKLDMIKQKLQLAVCSTLFLSTGLKY